MNPAVPSSWVPFPSIGTDRLYISPSADERALPSRFIQPLVCRKRGSLTEGAGHIGVDSRVLVEERYSVGSGSQHPSCPCAPDLPELGLPRPHYSLDAVLEAVGLSAASQRLLAGWRPTAIRPKVAVIDADVAGWKALGDGVDELSLELTPVNEWLQFPRILSKPAAEQTVVGHGVAMAGVVRAVAPTARIGLFEAPLTQSSYVYPTDLAAALARAVETWEADVVLVALAHGYWGMPAHLRSILRAAARYGRAGRGTAVVCCSGRLDQNRDCHGNSAALAGDDFTSQPWVIAVSACHLDGRWFRVNQYPLSRFGPAIELCAPGELVALPGIGTADDSSLAAALVAGTAARVLESNTELCVGELRHLLRLTASISEVDDSPSGAGLEAGCFNERDRSGHNFKVGYGRVHALGACLAAADPISYALLATRITPDGGDGPPPAIEMAQDWEHHLQQAATRSERARDYLELRPHLLPRCIASLDLQDALCWLARHLRALRHDEDSSWPEEKMDHGVLADRIEHVLRLLLEALGRLPASPTIERIRSWSEELLVTLTSMPANTTATFLAMILMPSEARGSSPAENSYWETQDELTRER